MKLWVKVFICVIISQSLLHLMPVSADINLQKIYQTDSTEFSMIRNLTIELGMSAPSSAGPWSGAELQSMLDRLAGIPLSKEKRTVYDWLCDKLPSADSTRTNSDFNFTVTPEAAAEIYAHTNSGTAYDEDTEWIEGYKERAPLISIPFEMWGTDLMYGFIDLTLQNNRFYTGTSSSAGFFGPPVTTNLIFDKLETNTDLSFPWRAFISLGDQNWNFQFGRDKISWGNGVSGNLVIDDHLNFHEFAKFKTFYEPFAYTFLAVSFPHPELYQLPPLLPDFEKENWKLSQTIDNIRAFIAHRFEFQLTQEFRLSLTEGIMYQGETYDFRFFSPLVILHNYFMLANSNSIMSLELDYTPLPSLLLHGQFVIDDLTTGDESVNAQPDAWGALASIHYTKSFKSGSFHAALEGAYTTPYLYLRNSRVFDGLGPDTEEDKFAQPINFIVGYPQYTQGAGNVVHKDFLGYSYGGDAIVGTFLGELIKLEDWKLSGNLFWMMHGVFDTDTLYEIGALPVSAQTPTSQSPSNITDKNSIETTFFASINGTKFIGKHFTLSAHLGWITKWNPGNIRTVEPVSDWQGRLGFTVAL